MSEMKKVAIITGGGSGIGLAIAKKFVDNDIRIVIIGRDEEKLLNACNILGENSDYIVSDISELSGLPQLVERITDKYGKIDILVNNAGINLKKSLLEVTDEEYTKIITTNQTAVFCLTREVAKVMLKQKKGSVLNISSMSVRYGLPYVIAYAASKSAIEGMTRVMAVELSPSGIRVNCIAPGFIRTKMSTTALEKDPDRRNRVLVRTPMGRLGETEEVADAAFYLTSDSASFITGAVLNVDGGHSIGF